MHICKLKCLEIKISTDLQYWAGGNDLAVEGKWTWNSNGDEFTFNRWHAPDPNNGGAGAGEDCLMINWAGQGMWEDAPCTWQKHFICQKLLVFCLFISFCSVSFFTF